MKQSEEHNNSRNLGSSERPVCGICRGRETVPFYETDNVPVLANVLCRTEAEARAMRTGKIALHFCKSCGHIWNAFFEPKLIEYTSYENPLDFSPSFRKYAEGLAQRLVEKHDTRGKRVLEIGCGDGFFLVLLCRLGKNRGVGFDPSYDPERGAKENGAERVTFIAESYDERHSDFEADLICCRHALEHIPQPVQFLSMMRNNIGSREGTVVYFEVPNGGWMVATLGLWDVIYEHCSYFCEDSLIEAFRRAGFRIRGTMEEFGNQFLCIEATPGTGGIGKKGGTVECSKPAPAAVEAFGKAARRKLDEWRARLRSARDQGRRSVIWGCGSKGVMFLNLLGGEGGIEYAVDINPRKHGMYVVRTAQRIVSPEFLRDYRPETIIVMNPVYLDEIQSMLDGLGVKAELLTA